MQRALVDVVHERPHPVDLDDGQPFAIARFELRVARNVDLLELEAELLACGPDGREPALAEVTALGVVDDDAARYG